MENKNTSKPPAAPLDGKSGGYKKNSKSTNVIKRFINFFNLFVLINKINSNKELKKQKKKIEEAEREKKIVEEVKQQIKDFRERIVYKFEKVTDCIEGHTYILKLIDTTNNTNAKIEYEKNSSSIIIRVYKENLQVQGHIISSKETLNMMPNAYYIKSILQDHGIKDFTKLKRRSDFPTFLLESDPYSEYLTSLGLSVSFIPMINFDWSFSHDIELFIKTYIPTSWIATLPTIE